MLYYTCYLVNLSINKAFNGYLCGFMVIYGYLVAYSL